MRILGLEITKVPKNTGDIWVRAGVAPLGLLISEMSPDELRRELAWVARELAKGNSLSVSPRDVFKRVLSFKPQLNAVKANKGAI